MQQGLFTIVLFPVSMLRLMDIHSRGKLPMKLIKHLVLAGALLVTTPCLALDFSQPIKTINGTDFVDATGKPTELTLLSVVENSLLGEQSPSEDAKRSNYLLVLDIHKHATDFTPTPDQIVQIRKALAATQPTAVYGQVMSMIDSTFVPKGVK